MAGLLAVVLVMAGSHVAVARYDMLALDLFNSGCIFVGGETTPVCDVDASTTPAPGDSVASAEPEPSAVGSDVPNVSIPPWDGKERLNVLLIGTDQRPKEGTYNTDTLIVVSIDPGTKQVAMFSLPRDTVDVPVPPGPARQAFGPVYPKKINAWFTSVRNRPDLFPGTDVTRGYNGLKAIIGNLYGLDIKYFVEVNFEGFKAVVDALGGVTVNVQIPVVDDTYPSDNGSLERVYIPSGIQHMDGAQALRYARSRHGKNGIGSNDFDRGARQQRVLLSLREQADPQSLIPRLPDLITALKKAVRTDVPVDQLDQLLGPRVAGRHQEHPLVRLRSAALRAGDPEQSARLHHRAGRRQDPGGGGGRASPPIRPTRRCARSWPRKPARSGSSTARAAPTGRRAWRRTSSTTGWPRRRRARSRRAASAPTPRSSSTTARRRRLPRPSPTWSRRSA